MNARNTLVAAAACLALAACSSNHDNFDKSTQYGPDPQLPEPSRALLPRMNVSEVVGWAQGETPTVPQGFRIEAIATGLSSPRNVYPLPNGDLLVIESKKEAKEPLERPKRLVMGWVEAKAHGSGNGPSNRILLLRDSNGDGKPDAQSVLIDHLNAPFGVVLVGDALYVADTDAILRYPFKAGDSKVGGEATKLVDLPAGPINHHWTKSLTISPDGSKLYATVGSNSNIVENGWDAERDRASVWEIDRATGAHRIFASGLRNPNSPQFYPGTNNIFVVVNERDELGAHLVPDYLTSIRAGGFYGWPYSYWGQHLDPRVRPQDPALVARAIKPDYALGSHVAALGLTFYTGNLLPAHYRGGAFIGEHGSWDRSPVNGYQVIFVPFVGGMPSGKPIPVVTGFLGKQSGTVRGRPVGLTLDRTGALIVADDTGNTVWRVSAAAHP